MLDQSPGIERNREELVSGQFLTLDGERYYAIGNVDRMPPFFVSVVSNDDHWLFVSSTGGLTAGRVSPESALFPYVPVDRIHESTGHTGPKTLLRVTSGRSPRVWEPFGEQRDPALRTTRNLYKSSLGNKLCFEEINHDLALAFRYTWATSDEYGFVRSCTLENTGARPVSVELLDGLLNVLPAGTPLVSQTNASNLVDAYKWTELDADSGLAIYSLYSRISDRAEPSESLHANSVFCLGLDDPAVFISAAQVDDIRAGDRPRPLRHTRGVRGAYLVQSSLELGPAAMHSWSIVANVGRTQSELVALRHELCDRQGLAAAVGASIDRGSDSLARIMAAADGLQVSAEENVTTHHYANVLFNVMRGGIFDDQYKVPTADFRESVRHFSRDVYRRNEELLDNLPATVEFSDLLALVQEQGDLQLERLCYEYLPITFGRRHGDPSRPWNQFSIRLRDDFGNHRLSYEGNWRDIFQNWEALTFSYPEFIENVIAKFVNASTMDGYNPYRITKSGIDWEVEEPDDPWSYIGYWGDHQIIYLLKLLELSNRFHPTRLAELLRRPIFSYANVPYRIKPFEALLENPKSTVAFDHGLAQRIEQRVLATGADGRLVIEPKGNVLQVNLLEKLLVPLLAKLGNFVVDGGIWLNTQRPEWNDANNALVGHGLSMVTLYYMRRYIHFLQRLLVAESGFFDISVSVAEWLQETTSALGGLRTHLGSGRVSAKQRYESMLDLGLAASRYRETIYQKEPYSGMQAVTHNEVLALLDNALAAIDHSIETNRRKDGLYHAYNLLGLQPKAVEIDALYPMLEGQVAALSSGAISPEHAADVVEALFASAIFRDDQHTFMLYPDRRLPGFFDKNRIPAERIEAIPLLGQMLEAGDERIVCHDSDGCYRFNADFSNAGDLQARLETIGGEAGSQIAAIRDELLALYEDVFHHRAFTGRSGTMFGFEGLGCIYWHMVAKLLLAVQENFFAAIERGANQETCLRLADLYYRVRDGLGFNKTPAEYGAFPTDPYSHTPGHAGAQQPGMTGQVKEEILTRFGELGVRVDNGQVRFEPRLLRPEEFATEDRQFRYVDVHGVWQELAVLKRALAFTWCQVPITYRQADGGDASLTLTWSDGRQQVLPTAVLPEDVSAELFERSGRIRQISLDLAPGQILAN
jgi:hypothetical protein